VTLGLDTRASIPILHLRQGTSLYGADRAVLALSSATALPYAPIIGAIVRPGAPDALAEEARRRGLLALRFDSAGRLDLACARAVAKAARERGVRLLHAHDFKALFVALLAGLMARIPVVATFHGDTRSTLAVRGYELVARVLGNFTRGVAAVSRALEGKLRRWVRAAPVAFVPNGLAAVPAVSPEEKARARAALAIAPEAYCIAVVGRLSQEKGHRVLFEAVRLLQSAQAARGAPVLLVAGDGPLNDELRAAARGLDARFLGYLDDARAVFAAADVVALPSLTEGLPLAALEALSLGRCLLASAVGELPELLADGAGALVPPGDAAALSEALAMLENGEVRARIERRALQRGRRYGVAAMASAYASLYGRALSPIPSTSR
jgi:glycosyltransferase involved in cell wall biosynthesis